MSETFIDVDTSDAVEPHAAAEGEHLIRVTGLLEDKDGNAIRTDKNGGKYFMLALDLPDDLSVKSFNHFVGLPNSSMDEKKLAATKWKLEEVKRAFKVEGQFDLNDLIGRETYALLRKEDTDAYGEQNSVKKFILGA